MTTHSNILAWRILWTADYSPLHHTVRHNWSDLSLRQEKVWWWEVPEVDWCVHDIRKDLRAFFSHSAIHSLSSLLMVALSAVCNSKCPVLTWQWPSRKEGGKQTFKKCVPRSLCNTYLLISLLKMGQHACPSDISLTKGLRSPWWMYLPTQHQGAFGKEGGWVLGIKIFI